MDSSYATGGEQLAVKGSEKSLMKVKEEMHLRTSFNYKLHTSKEYLQILFALKDRNNSSLATNNTLSEELMTYEPSRFGDEIHENDRNDNETKQPDDGTGLKNSNVQFENITFENIINNDSILTIKKKMIFNRYYTETSINKQELQINESNSNKNILLKTEYQH